MGRKSKVSSEEKIRVITEYLAGEKGPAQICLELNIGASTFQRWVAKYKNFGELAFVYSSANKHYSTELKVLAVEDYTSGKGSLLNIALKYEISSPRLLECWIKQYNGHKVMKSQNSTGEKYMTKGRKTTYEERVEIVSFCIENKDNYQLTAQKYQVSYQQVYTWTKKYKEYGPEALADRRGKRKGLDEMTDAEKLAAQVRLLEAENKRLQMENGFLKKLKEVERRQAGKTNI